MKTHNVTKDFKTLTEILCISSSIVRSAPSVLRLCVPVGAVIDDDGC